MSRSKRRGNILIAVLWVIVAMAILVTGLNFEARSDIERTILYRDRARAYWLARAAVERVKYDYAISIQNNDPNEDKTSRFRYEFDDGFAECLVRSNTSLMSVNATNRDMWLQLLTLFEEDEQIRDEIVDAILDWQDADDLERVNGAETDYYQSLSPPYIPRNGPFFSIEEIMLVKGITEAMYYGQPDKPGLKSLLVLNNQNISRFDVNTCPPGILMAFLEISAEEADEIVKAREEKQFANAQEVANVVAVGNPDSLSRFFMTYRGNQFTIKATAYVDGSQARYTVEDEVRYRGGGKLFVNLSHKDFSLEHVGESADEATE